MKKLIVTSILALSFITASASQFLESNSLNDTISKKETNTTVAEQYPVLVAEETDEPFEFNTKAYLPVGFNASLSLDENFDLDFSIEESDEPFEFNTKDYLPVGFNLSKEIVDSIVEIEVIEEDEPFGFDTKKYLPKGFIPTNRSVATNEL